VTKLIIDADPGIGDAIAIALALHDPGIDLVALTATAGVVSGRTATRNIEAIVEYLDPPKWPRIGASNSVAAEISYDINGQTILPTDLNGSDGLADQSWRCAELHNQRDAAKLMVDVVKEFPNEVTILSLGPLFNLEVAMERDADFLQRLNGLYCLGGTVKEQGNVTTTAEFNMYANPEGARVVLGSPATKTLIPLDISQQAVFTYDQMNRFEQNDKSRTVNFVHDLLTFALRANHQQCGIEGIALDAVVALAAIARPQLFSTQLARIDVETIGELTRGMTVVDDRDIPQWQTNIAIINEVDGQGVIDYFHKIVTAVKE